MLEYPKYITFPDINRIPTCVSQEFNNELDLEDGKVFYPKSPKIEKYFLSEYQSLRFGSAQFCGFLQDTVYVEHYVVIPAIRDVSLLPVKIPQKVQIDLFKLVADEGHHAAQALVLVNSIKDRFNIQLNEAGSEIPLFIRELEKHKNSYDDSIKKILFNMLVGIVTETRISKELGSFINNSDIIKSVRDHCKSHQDDETIHCSQFMALGKYTWSVFNEEQRELAAEIYAKTTIARSVPDVSRISFYLSQTTDINKKECDKIVNSIYTRDFLIEETLIAINSTMNFLKKLGVLDYKAARDIFQKAGFL
ncbi:MAG: hypothetical protein ACD_60C00087G0011 [uncultured bacterium]|nr:MAG: hypothetical protein ACD_60C00087G0011 [uncultured bacterium]